MNTDCSIARDLLPLYKEDLIEDQTTKWLEEHLNHCQKCANIQQLADQPIMKEDFSSPVNHENMMSKITFKLSLYQLILLGISFFLAIRTVILEENFEFILYYTILGLVTYLFYKNIKIVTLIAFLPVFLWHFGTMIPGLKDYAEGISITPLARVFDMSMVSLITGVIHLLFAIIGAVIGYCILKLIESEESK